MIHLGLKKLEYEVEFDASCYYPFTFSEERNHTKILFGVSFGFWWWENSIAVAFRPSENKLDKINLFAYTYNRGYKTVTFAGEVDIERKFKIALEFPMSKNKFNLKVYSPDEAKPMLHFSDYHTYPFLLAGYELKRNYEDKVILSRI